MHKILGKKEINIANEIKTVRLSLSACSERLILYALVGLLLNNP
jgi:hypothetical protein